MASKFTKALKAAISRKPAAPPLPLFVVACGGALTITAPDRASAKAAATKMLAALQSLEGVQTSLSEFTIVSVQKV